MTSDSSNSNDEDVDIVGSPVLISGRTTPIMGNSMWASATEAETKTGATPVSSRELDNSPRQFVIGDC